MVWSLRWCSSCAIMSLFYAAITSEQRKTMLQVILSAHIMMQFALDLRKGSSTVFTSIFLSTVAVVDLLGQFDVVAYKHTARN